MENVFHLARHSCGKFTKKTPLAAAAAAPSAVCRSCCLRWCFAASGSDGGDGGDEQQEAKERSEERRESDGKKKTGSNRISELSKKKRSKRNGDASVRKGHWDAGNSDSGSEGLPGLSAFFAPYPPARPPPPVRQLCVPLFLNAPTRFFFAVRGPIERPLVRSYFRGPTHLGKRRAAAAAAWLDCVLKIYVESLCMGQYAPTKQPRGFGLC